MYYIIDTAYHEEGKTFKGSTALPAEIAMWHEFCFGQ